MSYYDHFYEPSRPRKVAGGIKAQSKRGRFGTTWWGRRWIETLEGFDVDSRLGRGRSYARSGQVLSIDIAPGSVTARVQGSRPKPYAVTIRLKAYGEAAWGKVARSLRRQPFFAARLVAGAMPGELEPFFAAAGLSLFPQRSADLETDCSCPDWSNPCKHVAAVYYLLAEEFDRDPFLLFRLRGTTREALLEQITGRPPAKERAKGSHEVRATEETFSPVPLSPDALFWDEGPLPEAPFESPLLSPVTAALPKRLGAFPFWRAEEAFFDALEPIYRAASRRAQEILSEQSGAVV